MFEMKNDLPKMPLGLNQGSQQKQQLLNKKNDASSIGEIERLLGTGSVQGPLQFFNIVQDLEDLSCSSVCRNIYALLLL